MSKIAVLIVSFPGYTHSECFREVAETIHAGLRQLGHDSCITNSVVNGARHIVLGGHLLHQLNIPIPADSILYNLEQLIGNPISPSYINLLRQYVVWDFSKENVTELKRVGITPQGILPIGYFDGLRRIQLDETKDIDVLFIGSLNPRRQLVLNQLRDAGLRTLHLFDKYGSERDAYIARSKLLLNIHFYPAKILERVRLSYYLANSVPVLSEESRDDRDDADWHQGVRIVPYDRLVPEAVKLCSDEAALRDLAEGGFTFIKSRNIAQHLEKCLKRSKPVTAPRPTMKRNEACFCGSGKKFKHCHGAL